MEISKVKKAIERAMLALEDAIPVLERECGEGDQQQAAWEDLKDALQELRATDDML